MKIQKLYLVLLTALITASFLSVVGPASAAEAPQPAESADPCDFKLEEVGSFTKGKTYSAEQMLAGVDPRSALSSIGRWLARQGYSNLFVNLDIGVATANQIVFMGQGATVPFNVIATPAGSDGARVEIVVSLYPGAKLSEEKLREEFCGGFRAGPGHS